MMAAMETTTITSALVMDLDTVVDPPVELAFHKEGLAPMEEDMEVVVVAAAWEAVVVTTDGNPFLLNSIPEPSHLTTILSASAERSEHDGLLRPGNIPV